jgi:hypothetical protein
MTMKTTDYDQVFSSEPVDYDAVIVTTSRGEHWLPTRPEGWPATSYPAPPRLLRPSDAEADMTGKWYGKIKVIGLLREKPGWSLWLVRCQCGAYEDRTWTAISRRAGGACWRCDHWLRMQQGRQPHAVRKTFKPANASETILAARSVKHAARKEPATAMASALADALLKSLK